MKKSLVIIAALVGIGFLVLAWVYWTTPANALPSYLPGHDPAIMAVHVKHGLGALIVALALFVFAWFQSGKKK
jgi:hypothetical protein